MMPQGERVHSPRCHGDGGGEDGAEGNRRASAAVEAAAPPTAGEARQTSRKVLLQLPRVYGSGQRDHGFLGNISGQRLSHVVRILFPRDVGTVPWARAEKPRVVMEGRAPVSTVVART